MVVDWFELIGVIVDVGFCGCCDYVVGVGCLCIMCFVYCDVVGVVGSVGDVVVDFFVVGVVVCVD